MLERVEERDLFLRRIDEQWFRYHQLFLEFLRHRLAREVARAGRRAAPHRVKVVRRA
jgi:serine/threonine-protein kinase PknK